MRAALVVLILLPALESRAAPAKSTEKPCTPELALASKHPVLQRSLESALRREGFGGLLDKELLSVSLVDLSRRNRRYYAGINDDKMLYAASLPKVAILLTVIDAVESGRLDWNFEFDRRLQNMIVASSNEDASWGVDLVGLLAIEKVLRSPKYCFYQEPRGGLWVGRAYRPGGATNRDPLFDISHGATSRQAARFYSMLDSGKLVSKHWSFRMLGLMSPPKHFHKFVGSLSDEPGVVFLARKSGTWRNYHADSALIQAHGHRYVLVGLSKTPKGEAVMRGLAKVANEIIREGKHRKRVSRRRRPSARAR